MRTLAVALLPVSLFAIIFAAAPAGAQAPTPAPPPQVAYGAPITLEQAKKVLAAAEAEARKNNWNVVISVLDSGGHLVAMQRLDGTQLGSIEVARQKAYSAVLYRRPTKVFEDGVSQGGLNLRLLRLEGASPFEGGLPIMVDGKIVGAVGVSGVTSAQDGQIARAGAEAMK
jgi:uncharacterized protein GlcG (DUF336 family)